MCTTVSPGMGTYRHNWIAPKKKEASATGIKKQLAELYPTMKQDELEIMATVNTKKDIDAYLKAAGHDSKK
jgi:5,10-methylene-tetrahydrofolate dehydrogenase/methenyl tetrahydrofolate cyclohydrolase